MCMSVISVVDSRIWMGYLCGHLRKIQTSVMLMVSYCKFQFHVCKENLTHLEHPQYLRMLLNLMWLLIPAAAVFIATVCVEFEDHWTFLIPVQYLSSCCPPVSKDGGCFSRLELLTQIWPSSETLGNSWGWESIADGLVHCPPPFRTWELILLLLGDTATAGLRLCSRTTLRPRESPIPGDTPPRQQPTFND